MKKQLKLLKALLYDLIDIIFFLDIYISIVMKYSFKLYKITIIYTTLLGHHKKFWVVCFQT